MSQRRTVLSSLPEQRSRESGDQDRSEIPAWWPVRVCSWAPERECQIFRVESAAVVRVNRLANLAYRGGGGLQEVASHFPSGENLTAEIPAE